MRGDCMNKWEILGIEPTHDVKLIRRRYAELVRLYHPEDQPEIYQQIVEAYQSALREARSKKTRQESGRSEASSTQQLNEQENRTTNSATNSLDFESLESEEKTEQVDTAQPSLDFGDVHETAASNETYKEPVDPSLNFETVNENTSSQEAATSKNVLDFSDYLESEYLIRNAIESIVGNPDYTIGEQENLWKQLFNNYQDSLYFVKNVLEEMDVYIFNKPEQFSIIIPLLEDYVPDFKYWGYYYKLEFWREKIKETEKYEVSLENARKETEQFYASYLMCQEILDDFQTANQIKSWIEFFRHSYWSKMVLFQLNEEGYNIKSIPVLAYILDMIGQVKTKEDQKAYDELLAYFEELQADSEEPFDIHSYNLLNPSEVEEALYLLVYTPYQDEAILVDSWKHLLEKTQDKSLLLQLLEEIDVYPFTNKKVLNLVFRFVKNNIKDEENPYLKKFNFWNDIYSFPWAIKKYEFNKKEKFDYWYYEGYLFVDKLLKDDTLVNDWTIWEQVFKEKPRIYPIFFEQVYKEYHRFTDGELLKFILGQFHTSSMAPLLMTEETDLKLEEMTHYAYQLNHPNPKVSYLARIKRDVFKNRILTFTFAILTIISLFLSVYDEPGLNRWLYIGMVSLYNYYMHRRLDQPIKEGLNFRGKKIKFYYNRNLWVLAVILLSFVPVIPLGLISCLLFISIFSIIDGFHVRYGLRVTYSLNKLISIGLFLSAGFLVALATENELSFSLVFNYLYILIPVIAVVFYTKLKSGFPSSIIKVFLPALLGILVFYLIPYVHVRLAFFDAVILSMDTFKITLIVFLNAIALSYFTKEQSSRASVMKIYMIYGLQIFIFLRRFFIILFGPVTDLLAKKIDANVLLMNNEFAFYFLEWLFVLILLLLVRNIRKDNREDIG